MSRRLYTNNGHDFFVVSSLLQKSLRRGDITLAVRAMNELLPKYANYTWNRLLTVAAEDCADLVVGEVMACYLAWCKVNEGVNRATDMKKQSRIFFQKAIVLLAKSKHARDADELGHLVRDKLPDDVFQAAMNEAAAAGEDESDLDIPEWTYDVHTMKGKRSGLSKADFLRAEHAVMDASIFKNFDEMLEAWGYVEPDLDYS